MLTYGQIRRIVRMGYEDGATAQRESADQIGESTTWDESLINAIGPSKVCELFGVEMDSGEDWQMACLIYTAACNEGSARQAVEQS